jgi:hypothetical protein
MNNLFLITSMVLFMFTPAFAQEVVGDLSVELGVMSWEEVQADISKKPDTHSEDFHRKMAQSMSKMHGGGSKDTYHVMVMLSDKSTDKAVKHAEVEVTAVSMAGPEEIRHKLDPMYMDGFSGYGEFFKLKLKGPYKFKVRIKTYFRTYNTEFERTIL